MCLEVCTSGRSYETKLIGLLHRMSGGVFQAAVSLLCPGVGSQLGAVSPSVTVLQDPLATRATCLRGVPWWQPQESCWESTRRCSEAGRGREDCILCPDSQEPLRGPLHVCLPRIHPRSQPHGQTSGPLFQKDEGYVSVAACAP